MAVTLVTAVVLLGTIGSAVAHDDQATLVIESTEPAGPLAVTVQVSARYSEDQELVEEADPVATATGPGAALAPTPFAPVPETVGLYEATLTFDAPGAWSVTIASTEPAGTITQTVEVEGPSATTTTEPTTTTADEERSSDGEAAQATDDDGGTSLMTVALVLVLLVAAIVGVFVWRRTRSSGQSPTSDPG